jgi:fructokinase
MTSARGRIAVIGETLVDLIASDDRARPAQHLGGSPANVAVGLARLAQPACLITQIGSDHLGQFAHSRLSAEGVHVIRAGPDAPTSTALATLGAQGQATYTFSVGWDIAGARIPAGTTALHVGSLGLLLEPGAHHLWRLLCEQVRGSQLISMDPNIRADLLTDATAARKTLRWIAGLAHIVKLSDEDLEFLFPGSDPAGAGDILLGAPGRTALAIVTRGSKGALAFTGRHRLDIPAFEVPLADTVGAGDAFMAALLAGLAERNLLSPASLTDFAYAGPGPIRLIAEQASAAAAITCSRTGATPPSAAELRHFLAGQPSGIVPDALR